MTVFRGFATTVVSGLAFALVGGLTGYAMGTFAPDYYRVVFHIPPQVDFNSAHAGLGLGLTQGLVAGLVVGLVIVLTVAWYKSRQKVRLDTDEQGVAETTGGRSLLTKRRLALLAFVLPFLLAWPLNYWVLNLAGGWVVTTRLDSEHRRVHLGTMFLGLIVSISVMSFFIGSVLLWLDRWKRWVSGSMVVLFGLLSIPAVIFIGIGIRSYFRYG
jgi:hypothetical protein